MSRVLVIEDDEILNGGLCYNLQKRGITPFSAYTLEEAKGLLLKEAYDLIVLDVNLPDGSGFEFAQDTAALYEIPFIFLTAHNLEDEIIGGYHMGAEDYITKPLRIQIAMEKIQAVLRRCGGRHEESYYSCGNLDIDFEKRIVRKSGELLELTPTEIEDVEVYLDRSLKRFQTVFPACGSSNSAIELSISELEAYSGFRKWIDICKKMGE